MITDFLLKVISFILKVFYSIVATLVLLGFLVFYSFVFSFGFLVAKKVFDYVQGFAA